jgi:glycosyltransferase involved in cell wall biosynthesis
VAPVPWFPFKSKRFGLYGEYAQVARYENRFDIEIIHPRYWVIPKIGMNINPIILAIASYPVLKRMIKHGYDFDLIDAHYFYPDGIAAVIIGKLLNKPVIITARGTDINLISDYFLPRRMILWAAKQAKANITVSKALKNKLIEIGIDPENIHVLRNGVDLDFFKPLDREKLRLKLNLNRKTLVSVGNLIELKGHHLIIEAMRDLPEFVLLIVGGGPNLAFLEALIQKYKLSDRVTLLGTVSQQQLVEIYNAVDALVLASSREGLANVLLESMACGNPVIATNVGGTPEVVTTPEAGVLIKQRTAEGIKDAISTLFQSYPDRNETRKHAEGFSWNVTVDKLSQLMTQAI